MSLNIKLKDPKEIPDQGSKTHQYVDARVGTDDVVPLLLLLLARLGGEVQFKQSEIEDLLKSNIAAQFLVPLVKDRQGDVVFDGPSPIKDSSRNSIVRLIPINVNTRHEDGAGEPGGPVLVNTKGAPLN